MAKASCAYVSAFILGILGLLSVLAAIVAIAGFNINIDANNWLNVLFGIPTSPAFSAGCIFLATSVLLITIGDAK
ncbi:uncharacterized protein MONOS_17011 [Monocercomonoides exilis]|uniref:uncharacterized protein n=1 Tax=Monocercomonoides exilis TaxID=2049356 RepID=UPI00355A82F3|nr:hypothetical protein MONOS_17011 [Monocercomonoides exilis]